MNVCMYVCYPKDLPTAKWHNLMDPKIQRLSYIAPGPYYNIHIHNPD